MSSSSSPKNSKDWSANIARGTKEPSPLGTTTFVALRSADLLVQSALLTTGAIPSLLSRLGLRSIAPLQTFAALPPSSSTSFLGLGLVRSLTPYHATILAMAAGSALKQNLWATLISKEALPVALSLVVAAFNTVSNGLNSTLSIAAGSSQAPALHGVGPLEAPSAFPLAFHVGVALYVLGIGVEFISETQRKAFKDDPGNKWNPYSGGLFSLATSINYGGYVLWRTGFAMASGGWLWGAAVGGFHAYDFISRAIPGMDEYMEGKYGKNWDRVREKVKYRLLPGIY